VGALSARIDRLEQRIDAGLAPAVAAVPSPAPVVDGDAGRAVLGGRARRPIPAPAPPVADVPVVAPPAAAPAVAATAADLAKRWSNDVLPALKPMARARYSQLEVRGERDGVFTLVAPDEGTRVRVGLHRDEVEAAIASLFGVSVPFDIIVDQAPAAATSAADDGDGPDGDGHVDLDDLVDAPAEAVLSPLDRLHQAFPGSHEVDGP
jgi:DNA polymerase-3 subunit gamma/tau